MAIVLVTFGIEESLLEIVCLDFKMGLSKMLTVRQECSLESIDSAATMVVVCARWWWRSA